MNEELKSILQEQNEFVEMYIRQHYPNEGEYDQEEARSEALTAYYGLKGYKFGSDDDSFILPK